MYVQTITIYAMINVISLGNNSNFLQFLEGSIGNKQKVKVELLNTILKMRLLRDNGKYIELLLRKKKMRGNLI